MTWQDYDSFLNADQAGACGCSASAAAAAASSHLIQHHPAATESFGIGQMFTASDFQYLPGFVHLGVHAYFKPFGFIQQLLPNPFHPVKVRWLPCSLLVLLF